MFMGGIGLTRALHVIRVIKATILGGPRMQMARLRLSCCPVLAWQIHANRQDAVV